MQTFDYIDLLNRQYDKGKWIKACIVTENTAPLVEVFYADHEDPITFQGRTSVPLYMYWSNIKTSMSMPTDGSEIGLSNVGNKTVKYLKEVDITGNPVVIQLLHLDLLATLTSFATRKLKVLSVHADINAAIFTVGRQLGKNKLPRGVLTADEAPGLNSSIPRF